MAVTKHLQHVRSAQFTDDITGQTKTPVSPSSGDIKYGEIAINYHDGCERMFIRNDADKIVSFVNGDKVDSMIQSAISVLSPVDLWNGAGELAVYGGSGTVATGDLSFVHGQDTSASGKASHAEGNSTRANGNYSHAEGSSTSAIGDTSHVEGDRTKAIGIYSHAEGRRAIASGLSSHAEGDSTSSVGSCSHAEGGWTVASGNASHAEGASSSAIGESSHAEGSATTTNGKSSHAEGLSTNAIADSSHAEGSATTTIGQASHAEGEGTIASGLASHAEGVVTNANGDYSHAEGIETIASGYASHAEGEEVSAISQCSHAEGLSAVTTASGWSISEFGDLVFGTSKCAHAEGQETSAMGAASHAEGFKTEAKFRYEHATGKYNWSTGAARSSHTIFSVGVGTSNSDRRNGLVVWSDGKVDVYKSGTGNSTVYYSLVDTLDSKAGYKSFANYAAMTGATGVTDGMICYDQDGADYYIYNQNGGAFNPMGGGGQTYQFDNEPTSGSTNLLTSGTIYNTIGNINAILDSING